MERPLKKKLYPNSKGIIGINYLTSSQESTFIEYVASYEYGNKHTITNSDILENDILDKLFFQENQYGSSVSKSGRLFLKNKYLYMLGEGAKKYLIARESMRHDKSKLDELEKTIIKKVLDLFSNPSSEICLVSLGAANAEKEISELYNFWINYGKKHNITFIPIDVSVSLIQLAVLNFNNKFGNNSKVNIKSLIGDFWNIVEEKHLVSNCTPSIFTLLGSTMGNYKETALLDAIIQMMNNGDYLILGFDLNPSTSMATSAEIIYDQYNSDNNSEFLLSPLSHISMYKPYTNPSDTRYLSISKQETIVQPNKPEEYILLTDLEECTCYSRKLTIPETKNSEKLVINLAHSTKYNRDNFIEWIKTSYKYPSDKDKPITKNTLVKDEQIMKFEYLKDLSDTVPPKCCVTLRKIVVKKEKDPEQPKIETNF